MLKYYLAFMLSAVFVMPLMAEDTSDTLVDMEDVSDNDINTLVDEKTDLTDMKGDDVNLSMDTPLTDVDPLISDIPDPSSSLESKKLPPNPTSNNLDPSIQSTWDKNEKLVVEGGIKMLGKFLDHRLEKQKKEAAASKNVGNPNAQGKTGESPQDTKKKSKEISVENTKKEIDDLKAKIKSEKDKKKMGRFYYQLLDAKIQLALLTGNCPKELWLKNGFQDPKATSFDEKNWNRLLKANTKNTMKMFVRMISKMPKEDQDLEKARNELMAQIRSGQYPEKYKPKSKSPSASSANTPTPSKTVPDKTAPAKIK